MANRQWFCFHCRSPAWTREWWFPTGRGGPSAPAAKSPERVEARRPSQGGEGPSKRRRARRKRNAVPSASASPLMQTPSTSMPGLCSHSLSLWWMWFTGWRTPCEEEATVLFEWLPSSAVHKKLLELCHFNAGRLVQLTYTEASVKKTWKNEVMAYEYGNMVN